MQITPMIDWVSCIIPLKHEPINSGHVVKFDSHGEVEYDIPQNTKIEGSFSTKITVKSQGALDSKGRATELFFDGNPSKFVQGHNIFGMCDLRQLLHGVFRKIHAQNLFEFNLLDLFACIDSARIVRLDVTNSIRFGNRNQVRGYIKQLSQFAHTRNGRPQQKQWTLYFNGGSRRWSLTVYSKGDEIVKNPLHRDFEHADFIKSEANHLCRVEIRFLSLELVKLNINQVFRVNPERLTELYSEYVSKVIMSDTIELTSEVLAALPKVIRHTYLSWKSGISIQAEMSTPTYYRHRKELMNVGVDISVPYDSSATSDIVPLKTVVKAEPYQIPQEAIDKGLLYQYEAPKLRLIK